MITNIHEIKNQCTYHKLDEEQSCKYNELCKLARTFTLYIDNLCPNGLEKLLAITTFEEAFKEAIASSSESISSSNYLKDEDDLVSNIKMDNTFNMFSTKWHRETEAFIIEITKMYAMAEVANKSKSEFLANMSHELRTPNHAIGSFLEFALESFGYKISSVEPTKEELIVVFDKFVAEAEMASAENELTVFFQKRLGKVLHHLTRAHRANEGLIELLDGILNLAKIESGKMVFNFAENNLITLFEAVTLRCETLCAARQIKIVIEVADDIDSNIVVANVDPGKIMQVYTNLLGNAIKFSPRGSTIHARFAVDEKVVAFSISDQGPGIPINELKTIFDQFVQSELMARGTTGTGLGLPICLELISRHGGQIYAENNADGGSTFFVELPRVQQEKKVEM